MSAGRRPFRVESSEQPGWAGDASGQAAVAGQLDRIFGELADLRALVETFANREAEQSRHREEQALWTGVAAIQQAIKKTKGEIAVLHAKGVQGEQLVRATDELDAVVSDTEGATESILTAAESIDAAASKLMGQLEGVQRELAADIHKQAIRIFEACNFQDISGQRISKVVTVLQFIEMRVASMMDIWGGVDDFGVVVEPTGAEGEGDAALLNGPALAGDVGVVSQDDIDSLFA
jgi:chemotaxis protein CheZ